MILDSLEASFTGSVRSAMSLVNTSSCWPSKVTGCKPGSDRSPEVSITDPAGISTKLCFESCAVIARIGKVTCRRTAVGIAGMLLLSWGRSYSSFAVVEPLLVKVLTTDRDAAVTTCLPLDIPDPLDGRGYLSEWKNPESFRRSAEWS